LSGVGGQQPVNERDSDIAAGLLDAADIAIRRSVAGDLDDSQGRSNAAIGKCLYLGAQLFAHGFGERASIEDCSSHWLFRVQSFRRY
jgi:hypothetical protein